jgi:hypothetical protein
MVRQSFLPKPIIEEAEIKISNVKLVDIDIIGCDMKELLETPTPSKLYTATATRFGFED